MSKSTGVNANTRKPRPKQTGVLVGARVQPDFLEAIDSFRATQRPIPSRPEALRHLASIGLESLPIIHEMLDFFEQHGDAADPEVQAQITRLKGIASV